MKSNGNLFYSDDYGQIYEVEWYTDNNGILIVKTVSKQPYVWGEVEQFKYENGILYKKGIISTVIQSIKDINGGYIILSEGSNQEVAYIQVNFPCSTQPSDRFLYHLNNFISVDINNVISDGSCWTDIYDSNIVIWGNINNDGTISDVPTNGLMLQWLDIWA